MNALRSTWLMLAAIAVAAPGCLLVQPLDDVSADSAGSGGSGTGKAGAGPSPSGGKAGAGPAPNGGRGGAASGGRGGSGPTPTAGAPGQVDFSYFTGIWTVTSGTITTDCGTGPIDTDATPGTTDTIDLGTTSDLIVDKGTKCPVLADVNDLVAIGQDGQSCDFPDTSGMYHLEINAFDFVVDGTHQKASSSLLSVITVTNNGVVTTCDSDQELYYTR